MTPREALTALCVGTRTIPVTCEAAREVLEKEIERARVVGVLDAWADRIGKSWRMYTPDRGDARWDCRLGGRVLMYFGHSADAARAAAAKAIESEEERRANEGGVRL